MTTTQYYLQLTNKKRLKTLFLSQRVPYPPNKGEKIRTFHQIEYLLNNNHKIYLCSPYTSEEELIHFENFTQKKGVNSQNSKLKNKYLSYLSGFILKKPLSVSNFYSRELQKTIDHLIDNEAFQNIVCTSSSMAEYIFNSSTLQKLKIRPKLLMDFMDLDSDKWRQYSLLSQNLMKWVYKREEKLLSKYEQKIYRLFDTCFFVSETEVELFCNKYECIDRPLAISNGIDTEFFIPPVRHPNNDHPVFLFTGVMDYKPNIESVLWFIEYVWPRIIKKYDKARFIIAGMNPVSPISALGRTKGVEVTGYIEDILPYYHQSDIFIAPLRIARGLQNKILQAFSCGVPVISTSMGAEGIDVTDGVNILIADTPDMFFDTIEKLKNNIALYESIRENALSLAKNHYSWSEILKKLGNILE